MLAKKIDRDACAAQSSGVGDAPSTKGRFSTLRSIVKGVSISIIGTLVALLLVEGAFRLLVGGGEKKDKQQVVTDVPRYDYLPEGAYRARDYYYTPEKAPGVFRIIVVGDSFTFGGKMHFDDNFCKRLERMLNLNDHQRKVEVLNWGVSGYSSLQEVELVREAVSRFQPDLVVVQITLNDAELQPFRVTHHYQNKRGKVILTNPLFKYWQSLGYIVRRIYYTRMHEEYITYHTAAFENPDSWKLFTGAFQQMQRLTSERGVPLLAVIFPMMSHSFDDKYPFHAVHQKIGAALAEQKISYVDLFEDFRGKDPVRLQVEPGQDAHPNEIAHRVAADRIYTTLLNLKWLPNDVEIKKYSKRMLIKPTAVKPVNGSVAVTVPAPSRKHR